MSWAHSVCMSHQKTMLVIMKQEILLEDVLTEMVECKWLEAHARNNTVSWPHG